MIPKLVKPTSKIQQKITSLTKFSSMPLQCQKEIQFPFGHLKIPTPTIPLKAILNMVGSQISTPLEPTTNFSLYTQY